MEEGNHSVILQGHFILQGLTDNPKVQLPLFMTFLLVYVMTVIGNLGMIVLICVEHQLHTPMYFFLGNLSFADLCCSSAISPKMLAGFLAKNSTISYHACAIQLFLFAMFGDVECLLLALMAYDRYVAICRPLHYSAMMSKKVCRQLMATAYFIGMVDSLIHTCCTFQLPFCRSNTINHFFCDEPPLLVLSCSDTATNEIILSTLVGSIVASSICMILISYVYILSTIIRMRSAEGRGKAFSTCISHLMAVGMFHGTLLFMYLRPSSSYSMDQDKWASMFYTVIIPMVNPIIYSLRNKDVKDALTRVLGKIGLLKGRVIASQ